MKTTLLRRRRRDGVIAIDLGTSRTQIFLPHAGIVLDEPTLTAYSASGDVIAAGRDAWVASEVGHAQLRMPVRGGVVRDPVGCVHTVRLLLRKAGLPSTDGRYIAVSLPATATARDASVLTAVMASATGGRVVPVESTLAASIGTGIDIGSDAPHIVCDVGAGVTELAVIADGHLVSGSALRMGIRDYDDEPERAVRRVVQLLRRVLDDLPDSVAADARRRRTAPRRRRGVCARAGRAAVRGLSHADPHPGRPSAGRRQRTGRCLTGPTLAAQAF